MIKSIAHNIDCIEAMKSFNDNEFDLAVVDPPYGIGADLFNNGTFTNKGIKNKYPSVSTATKLKAKNRLNRGGGKLKNRMLTQSNCSWDVAPPREYFEQLFRVSKNQIIWGGNYFDLPPTRGVICWDKMQPWENFSQFELAWTSFDKPAKMFRHSNTGGANNFPKIHPTQKPVELYAWIYSKYGFDGMKVIDTHQGSGTNRIAANWSEFKINYVGYETDSEMFEKSEKLYKMMTAQQRLF